MLSGCVHQVSEYQASGLNNYLLVNCAEGGELTEGNWPTWTHYGDRSGICSAEITRRIQAGSLSREELLVDAQRVRREMILGY